MDALVVANTPNRLHALTDVLHHEKINCVVCSTASEARNTVMCRRFDLFVINGGLPDELGNELAMNIALNFDCGGIYIDESIRADRISEELGECGIITLSRPVTKSQLVEALRLIKVSNARVMQLKLKNEELQAKLDDLKFISRAKIILMRTLGLSESQAHKHIEKQAMVQRVSRRKVAMDIINSYEAI